MRPVKPKVRGEATLRKNTDLVSFLRDRIPSAELPAARAMLAMLVTCSLLDVACIQLAGDAEDTPRHGRGTIVVRVVDARHRPLPEQWEIVGYELQPSSRAGHITRERDLSTGTFRLDGLGEGNYELSASCPMAGSVSGPALHLRDGTTVQCEIVYDGPDLSRRIAVHTDTARVYFPASDIRSVSLITAASAEHRLPKVLPHQDTFVFDDLPDGEHLVEIDDPRFSKWISPPIAPGTEVHVKLFGSSAIELDVWDATFACPAKVFSVSTVMKDIAGPLTLVKEGDELPPDGVLRGLFPGTLRIVVAKPGYRAADLAVLDLLPGETRRVRTELVRE
jgi:hypothetical protein